MNSLYNLLLRQSSSLHSDLSRLETSFLSSQAIPHPSSISSFNSSLSAFSRTIDDYDSLSKRELNQIKQSKAFNRVEKFRQEEIQLRNSLEGLKLGKVAQKQPQFKSDHDSQNTNGSIESTSKTSAYSPRSPTFSPSSSSNNLNPSNSTTTTTAESPFSNIHSRTISSNLYPNSNPSSNPSSDPLSAYRMNDSAAAMFGSSSNREGMALREHSFIQNTEAQLDAFIAQGKEVWGNLSEQRDILKGTQRRLLDAANTIGLSRDVIGYIERRSTQDNIILVLGAIFTLVCFWYIYKWFG